jgi:hypothetical protein
MTEPYDLAQHLRDATLADLIDTVGREISYGTAVRLKNAVAAQIDCAHTNGYNKGWRDGAVGYQEPSDA